MTKFGSGARMADESGIADGMPGSDASTLNGLNSDVPESDVPTSNGLNSDVPGPDVPGPDVPGPDVPGPDVPESDGRRRAPRGNRMLMLVALALAAGGVAEFCLAGADGAGPPRPAANVLGKLPPSAASSSAAATQAALAPMPYSVPTHVAIPAVGLDADVISVDVNADGSVGTPSLADAKAAGWYDRGPTPGQPGASVLDAHVDSSMMSDYRGAFFYLGLAKPGMRIDVTRADHSTAEFTIDEVEVALKSDFPADKVYGQTSYPALRLITCGGDYDKKAHEYLGNTIVYAHLTGEMAGRKALGS